MIVVGVGRMAATGRLPRNLFAGIRIPSTMRSDEAWRAAQRARKRLESRSIRLRSTTTTDRRAAATVG
jgi:SdpI/YfhL protein family